MLFLQCCRAQEKRPLAILGIFSVIIQYYTLLLVCSVNLAPNLIFFLINNMRYDIKTMISKPSR